MLIMSFSERNSWDSADSEFQDAYQRVQDAREEADSAEASKEHLQTFSRSVHCMQASLKKMQKDAMRAVDRKAAVCRCALVSTVSISVIL